MSTVPTRFAAMILSLAGPFRQRTWRPAEQMRERSAAGAMTAGAVERWPGCLPRRRLRCASMHTPLRFPKRAARHPAAALLLAVVAALLAGCGTTLSRRTPDDPAEAVAAAPLPAPASSERDGPEAHPPPDLERVPDAEPRVEPIRAGGPNKPYQAFGTAYVPITDDSRYDQRGLASWYGRKFHGRRTASGETYNMYAMTAAHRTLPIPSYARVRNPANGRSAIVRINDRGPFHAARIIDLSYVAALKLGLLQATAPVEVRRLTHDDIRAGRWRETPGDATAAPGPEAAAATTFAVPGPAPTAQPDAPGVAGPLASDRAAVPVPPELVLAPVAAGMADAPPIPAAPSMPHRAFTAAARGYWVQLGAFRDAGGARDLQAQVGVQLGWLAPLLAVFDEAALHRLQAGPYPTREQAASALRRIRAALPLTPLLVERR